MMSEKYEISKIDVKPIQLVFWILTGISLVIMAFFLFLNFNSGTILACLIGLLLNGLFQYSNTKTWNVWYQDGKMYFQNIYQTQIYDIELFERVEMTSVYRNNYTVYLTNNKIFNFRIKQTDDIKLLFKKDDQYYAREVTRKLNDLK